VAFPVSSRPVGHSVARSGPPSAWIRLTGGVDLATVPSLAGYADRLHGLALRLIVVDLTTVTYVGSTFVNFLVTLRDSHPESQLVLHNPSMLARTVLVATGIDRHVVMSVHSEPPAGSPGPDDAAVTIVQLGAGHAATS
jgi:anti-anti-sigma regulatory factor